jgi:1-hydroxycarotenoid 3,4-desaturase
VQRIDCLNGRATGITLASGETHSADVVVFNGDTAALSDGLLGADVSTSVPVRPRHQRGLSAITWCINAETSGFELDHHNVFFAQNYAQEFSTIFEQRGICNEPTVYVCAQDRINGAPLKAGTERLLLLINAPADGDHKAWTRNKLDEQKEHALSVVKRGGANITFSEQNCVVSSPDDWHHRFPASGGSLYGAASHGMFSSFTRPSTKSRVKGLYLSGGSVHPGPGVPMATLSGTLAARQIVKDTA